MKEILTDWIVNLALFSLFSSMIARILPGKSYAPYIQIFCGILMILTLLQPILKLTGLENQIDFNLAEELYEIERNQMESHLIRIEEEQKMEVEKRYQEYLEEQPDGVEEQN